MIKRWFKRWMKLIEAARIEDAKLKKGSGIRGLSQFIAIFFGWAIAMFSGGEG